MRRLGSVSLKNEGEKVFYEVSVSDGKIWYSIDKKYSDMLSNKVDAAAIAILYPSMKEGVDITIDGEISEELLYYISGPLQAALIAMNGKLKKIKINANSVSVSNAGNFVATGFSGGIDSFSVIKRYFMQNKFPGFQITHLTLHDVWNSEKFVDFQNPNLNQGMKNVKILADRWNLPLVMISSNVGSYYKGIRFEDTHTLRNASAAHAISARVGKYIYASAYPMPLQTLSGANTMARGDTIILPMLSSNSLRCYSGEPELSRIEKTEYISDVDETKQYLHVCSKIWDKNCSSCVKCRRTLLTLEVMGKLSEYKNIFNIDKYKKEKPEWIHSYFEGSDIYMKEIKSYCEVKGIDPIK